MNKWELARYLIDAKKCVDSVLFIAENVKALSNLSLRDIVEDRQRKFYINVKVIYDKSVSKADQKTLKSTDIIYEETCKERDKNYAHKDDNYIQPDYESILEIANIMKERLQHCFKLCKDSLPDVLTLDFIDYDRDLYRFLNKIDTEKEEELLSLQHPLYGVKPTEEELKNSFTRKVFNDTEDIKKINNPDDYAVIMKSGLTVREGIQEMQDACVRINVLTNQNMWAEPNMKVIEEMKKMIEECPELPFLY
ncbi:MAG: hypothetical protein PUG97_02470 [bacterium]|nr:hypothetical protein [Bacilli bacterium]MDD7328613.1 hypothetical protein [bacterium]MDD7618202.1 hypothetical protein [bacterium]MDY5910222.1 hypothetical protein [Candidatus Enterosoma sp.]